MANILRSNFLCALGDADETLAAIQNQKLNIGLKNVTAIEGDVEIPYFLLQERIQEKPQEIYAALHKILAKTIGHLSAEDKKNTALLVGTSVIDLKTIETIEETLYEESKTPYHSEKKSIDSYAQELSSSFALNGFTQTINTACTSSANAILEASNLIDAKIFKYVVVLSVEIFSKIMSSGFYAMQLLSQSTIKPFDKERDGMVLGEGIASVLLGSDTSPWRVKGGFSNCNALNITAVSEEGSEFVEVMQKALTLTDTTPNDITLLKAHATGTTSNDLSEINAISKVFKEGVPFTALKPYIGHTIGACGILELALLIKSVDAGFIPKTLNTQENMNANYTPLLEHIPCSSGTFMLNYFGFGGNNTSIILHKETL